ncbi:DNA helicase IV [Neomicrococcus aestuarii]|uniref:DNA helicase IV n=1 Tax=Neomicrococcus aestuarii TaxID=556325 RepID=A0A7W8TW10_9MICC|nr:UvrD-helicase domain-containing protein [Neomicrococcus aestuarii]MBB5513863.1 DNA helicase IV [Neomicrococcus aestuarii]
MEIDYADELTEEQSYFDRAREAYEVRLQSSDPAQWTVGNGPERRAMKKAMDAKPKLEADESVAFGRMILNDGRSYHVGKVGISDEEKNQLVVSWQAPIAERFYQATTDDHMGVATKRTFTTTRNHVDAFSDKIFAELARKIESLDDELRSDDALLHSLEASRTGKMTDIVQTIQAAQDKLIRLSKDQLLVIQGGPGTGKTAVALHRASWLMFNYQAELPASEMLIVGPNPAFTKYIQQVLPALGDQHVRQTSIQEMLSSELPVRAAETDHVARVKGLAEMEDVIATGLDNRIKEPETPLRISRRNSAAAVSISPETIAGDIKELRHKQYGEGRELLKQRLLEHCARSVSSVSQLSGAALMDPQSVESALDRMWPRLSAPQFIRELLGSKQRLRTAAQNILTDEQIELLYRGAADRIADEPWTIADLALIDSAAEFMNGESTLYRHIIVDEAQDLSPMQLIALRRRSRDGSMTIVGDVAQSTGPFARDSWDEIVEALKSKLETNLQHLEHGYRVPEEVFAVAKRLLPIAAPRIQSPKIVRKANAAPQLFDVVREQMAREVAKTSSHHSSKGRFVGVIAPKEWWEQIQEAFRAEEVKWSDSSAGNLGTSINLVTPEDSKGLEFDAVVVVDPQAIFDRDNGARLLYIALTRTTSRLDVIAPSGEIPSVIREAFPELTRIDAPDVASPSEITMSMDSSSDELAKSVPAVELTTERSTKASSEPRPDEGMVDVASTREMELVGDQRTLGPVERELVRRNAEYLHEVILTMFGAEIQREIIVETLRIFDESAADEASQ